MFRTPKRSKKLKHYYKIYIALHTTSFQNLNFCQKFKTLLNCIFRTTRLSKYIVECIFTACIVAEQGAHSLKIYRLKDQNSKPLYKVQGVRNGQNN